MTMKKHFLQNTIYEKNGVVYNINMHDAWMQQQCIYYNVSILLKFILLLPPDDLVSNDPPNKENPLKSFFVQIGSARPMRGQNYRTPIIRVLPLIDELKTKVEEYVFRTVIKICQTLHNRINKILLNVIIFILGRSYFPRK